MQEVIEFLIANNMGCLATVENGEPRVRPWGFMFEKSGKLYFCTSSLKEAYRQMLENPMVEFTSTSASRDWVRLRGKAVFTDDPGLKERIFEKFAFIKQLYQSPDNPIFKLFYIEHGRAMLGDFLGQPPKTFEF